MSADADSVDMTAALINGLKQQGLEHFMTVYSHITQYKQCIPDQTSQCKLQTGHFFSLILPTAIKPILYTMYYITQNFNILSQIIYIYILKNNYWIIFYGLREIDNRLIALNSILSNCVVATYNGK